MSTLLQDFRYGCRMMWKSPAFTVVAVLSLALGIGANTTIFTGVKSLLLNPLPGVAAADRLTMVHGVLANAGSRVISNSYPDYIDYRDRNDTFSNLAAYSLQTFNFGGGEGAPERVWGELVSGNYFDTLGVRALRGRTFLPEEDNAADPHAVVVISYKLWQNRFAANPEIADQTVLLNNQPFRIIGVAPKEFGGSFVGLGLDAWVPVAMQPQVASGGNRLKRRGNQWLQVVGRLKPGITIEQAASNLKSIARALAREYPPTDEGHDIAVFTVLRDPDSAQQILVPVFALLLVVAGIVLLIACANVANLFMARAAARRKEFGVRVALGASRSRVVRQLLTESFALAGMGGIVGLLVTFWTADLFRLLLPTFGFPVVMDFSVDTRVFLFALVVSVLTSFVFGLIPALQNSRPDLVATLKDEAGAIAGGGRRKSLLRSALVVAQIALSLVLLVAAGLMIRTLQKARAANPGFNPDGVVLASFNLFLNGYDRDRGAEFERQLLERLTSLPGVESAALADKPPLNLFSHNSSSFEVEGYAKRPDEELNIENGIVSTGYFRTIENQILRGRDFDARDTQKSPAVVIINETMARRYFKAGEDPVGKRLQSGPDTEQIIGVARDVKYHHMNEEPVPYVYFPLAQNYDSQMTVMVRYRDSPSSALSSIRDQVRALDPNLALFDEKTLVEHTGLSLFAERMAGTLLGLIGLVALLLATSGLYGVMAYTVAQRTHEIGIRMALGAGRREVLNLVIGHGMLLTAIGLGVGLGAAFALTRAMSSLVFGVSATDPLTFLSISLLLALVAFIACYIPARRATKVDPMVALRYE